MKSVFAVLLMMMMEGLPAWAALGDNVASVDSDAHVLGGQHVMVTSTDGYYAF